jgi:hypothetical protein
MSSQATGLAAGHLTPQELELGRSCFERSRASLLQSAQGLSEAQLHFKPSPECWSIAEILEHVVVVQEMILGPLWARLLESPAPAVYDAKAVEAILSTGIPDRSVKFPAPEQVHPSGRLTVAESLERFIANDGKLRERLESAPDLRLHAIPAAPIKAISKGAHELLDGYGWLLLVARHSERHALQIQELRAHAGFPCAT